YQSITRKIAAHLGITIFLNHTKASDVAFYVFVWKIFDIVPDKDSLYYYYEDTSWDMAKYRRTIIRIMPEQIQKMYYEGRYLVFFVAISAILLCLATGEVPSRLTQIVVENTGIGKNTGNRMHKHAIERQTNTLVKITIETLIRGPTNEAELLTNDQREHTGLQKLTKESLGILTCFKHILSKMGPNLCYLTNYKDGHERDE
ncbi:hypothetical protein ACJX0J_014918, partial [Zea mays]